MPLHPNKLTGLIRVLKYYDFFRYAATLDDIYIAYPYKISAAHMKLILHAAVAEKRILSKNIAGTSYYTLPPQGIALHEVVRKIKNTSEIFSRSKMFLFCAKYYAPVQLIGLSGSLAMNNAGKNDDIDFFVMSAPERVWSTRMFLLLLATLCGVRRTRGLKNAPGQVCLNLFFDGSDVQIPHAKRTLYVAHEVIQMKPLISRNGAYEKFLKANEWIYAYFPNAQAVLLARNSTLVHAYEGHISINIPSFIANILETLFKKLQQKIIAKHLTNELVSNTQMWFYPDDFEEKMRKGRMI